MADKNPNEQKKPNLWKRSTLSVRLIFATFIIVIVIVVVVLILYFVLSFQNKKTSQNNLETLYLNKQSYLNTYNNDNFNLLGKDEPKSKEIFYVNYISNEDSFLTGEQAERACMELGDDINLATEKELNQGYKDGASWKYFGWVKSSTNNKYIQAYPLSQEDAIYLQTDEFEIVKNSNIQNTRAGAICYGVKPKQEFSFGILPFNLKNFYSKKVKFE